MSKRQSGGAASQAEERIRRAVLDRDMEIEMAHRRFWTRVGAEMVAGQISQTEVARVLDLTRETVRQRTRQYLPDAPVRPRRGQPLFLAVGMRLTGEMAWRNQSESCDGLKVVTMSLGGNSPYAGRTIDLAYREIEKPPPFSSRGHAPIFSAPGLNSRPLFVSDAVDDELFGPANVDSREYREWQKRVSDLPVLAPSI